MRYWHFNRGDEEVFRWTDVMPGDMVHSPGVLGWHFRNRNNRHDHNMIIFAHKLLLVLARYDGPPDDSLETGVTTFLCMSRHGLVFIVQNKVERDVDEDQAP